MIEVIFKQRALRDIKEAINWYHHQSVGLGYEFLNCVEDATDKIKDSPELYPVVYKNLQRILLKRFPFSIFYLYEENKIYIISVFDNRQNPSKLP